MNYDFTTQVNRKAHGASKWNGMYKEHPTTPEGIIPLSVADMEFKNAPEIINGLKQQLDEQILGYAGPTDSYYNAVIHWMQRRHHWAIEKDWIVTTPGVVTALKFLVQSVTQPGDGVLILTPVYYPFYTVIDSNACTRVTSKLCYENGRYTIDFADLEAKAKDPKTTAMILCSPHNPIGRVWTKEELSRIADICLAHQVHLIVDEIHHDLIMPNYTHTVLAGINEKYADAVATCTSCSKSFNLAGLKVSNIIIKNEEWRKQFTEALSKARYGSLNIFAYQACISAYNDAEAWLDACVQVIDENRAYLKEFIETKLPELTVVPLEGTYLQWVDCRKLKLSTEELEQKMTEHFLFLDEGYVFGEGGKGFERINIACPKVTLVKALDRLADLVKELR